MIPRPQSRLDGPSPQTRVDLREVSLTVFSLTPSRLAADDSADLRRPTTTPLAVLTVGSKPPGTLLEPARLEHCARATRRRSAIPGSCRPNTVRQGLRVSIFHQVAHAPASGCKTCSGSANVVRITTAVSGALRRVCGWPPHRP